MRNYCSHLLKRTLSSGDNSGGSLREGVFGLFLILTPFVPSISVDHLIPFPPILCVS